MCYNRGVLLRCLGYIYKKQKDGVSKDRVSHNRVMKNIAKNHVILLKVYDLMGHIISFIGRSSRELDTSDL